MASLNSSLQDLRARLNKVELGKLGKLELGKLGKLELGKLGKLELGKLGRGGAGKRSSGGQLITGLDIEPGQVIAAQVQVNGGVKVQRAAGIPIASDVVRDGEVADVEALTEALRTVFSQHKLPRQVRVGVANQRIMVRTLEFPPIPDERELDAAVRFRALDEIPMPPDTVVLDYHSLGVFDTVSGPRQRVLLVAARRDMIERLLSAVEAAGLRPEGIDLSAFAIIRALHQSGGDPDAPVLYLHLSGLTNLVVARGVSCVFTRVLGTGLEAIAITVAERCVVPIDEARALIFRVGLTAGPAHADVPVPARPDTVAEPPAMTAPVTPDVENMVFEAPQADAPPAEGHHPAEERIAPVEDGVADVEDGVPGAEGEKPATFTADPVTNEAAPARAEGADGEADRDTTETSASELERLMTVRAAISDGLRLVVAEVRNSLDYHLGHVGGGSDRPVERVVLSGPAVGVPGLLEALQSELKLPISAGEVDVSDASAASGVPASRLAVAAGLAVNEVKP